MNNRLDRVSTIISALRRLTIELDHIHHCSVRAEPTATRVEVQRNRRDRAEPTAVRVRARVEVHRRDQAEPTAARVQVVQGVVIAAQRARDCEIESAAPREIEIGDIVRITNDYKNLRGTCGQLVKKTRCRGTLVSASGATYVRSLENLDLV